MGVEDDDRKREELMKLVEAVRGVACYIVPEIAGFKAYLRNRIALNNEMYKIGESCIKIESACRTVERKIRDLRQDAVLYRVKPLGNEPTDQDGGEK